MPRTDYLQVVLAATTAAGTSWDTAAAVQPTFQVQGAYSVVRFTVTLPAGVQGTLHLRPRVRRDKSNDTQDLCRFASADYRYLSGDNWAGVPFECDVPMRPGDWLDVWYDNTDSVNDHWFSVAATLAAKGAG